MLKSRANFGIDSAKTSLVIIYILSKEIEHCVRTTLYCQVRNLLEWTH